MNCIESHFTIARGDSVSRRLEKMEINVESTVGLGIPGSINDVEPTDSVAELKERIATLQAVDANQITLLFRGKPMDERRTLEKIGITDGDTVTVAPRAREGGSGLPPSFISNRISLESKHIKENQIPLKPVSTHLWEGHLIGMGRWQGQAFRIKIELNGQYPYYPPKVKFLDVPANHPNIHTNGSICLNLLTSNGWRPTYTMVTVYRTLQDLLRSPNYHSPVMSYRTNGLKTMGRRFLEIIQG